MSQQSALRPEELFAARRRRRGAGWPVVTPGMPSQMESGVTVGPQPIPMLQARLQLMVNLPHVAMVIQGPGLPAFAIPFDHDQAVAFAVGLIKAATALEFALAEQKEKQAELEAEMRIAESDAANDDLLQQAIANTGPLSVPVEPTADNRSPGSPILLPGE